MNEGKYRAYCPCETCDRLFDFNPCSLNLDGVPPEGAVFEKTVVNGWEGFSITSCPEYMPEKKRKAENLDTAGCVELLAAVVDRAVKDYEGCVRNIRKAEAQAVAWDRIETNLRSSMRMIERFMPERGQNRLDEIRHKRKEYKLPDAEKVVEITEAEARAERAEAIIALAEARNEWLEDFNAALLRTMKLGRNLCDLCVERHTPAHMGCDKMCRNCDDKCVCGECIRFNKFEYRGQK